MGSMRSAIVAPTIWIGMSRSVRSTFLPAWRFPAAIAASRMPTAIGLRILMSVHTAAIAMTPAPMNLTWSMKTLLTASSDAVADSSPHTRVGRRTPKDSTTPTTMEIPTLKPTRWPTPSRPMLAPAPIHVAKGPALRAAVTSAAAILRFVKRENPAEARPPTTIARMPRRL